MFSMLCFSCFQFRFNTSLHGLTFSSLPRILSLQSSLVPQLATLEPCLFHLYAQERITGYNSLLWAEVSRFLLVLEKVVGLGNGMLYGLLCLGWNVWLIWFSKLESVIFKVCDCCIYGARSLKIFLGNAKVIKKSYLLFFFLR